jgi:hypothetical protein
VSGADRAADRPGVELPGARADKYPRAPHRDRGPPRGQAGRRSRAPQTYRQDESWRRIRRSSLFV